MLSVAAGLCLALVTGRQTPLQVLLHPLRRHLALGCPTPRRKLENGNSHELCGPCGLRPQSFLTVALCCWHCAFTWRPVKGERDVPTKIGNRLLALGFSCGVVALQAYIFFIIAFCFYMYIRVTKTLGLGSYLWYGCIVLAVEVLGASTTLIYGAPPATAGQPLRDRKLASP